jgi:predicted membrane protein
MNYNFTLKDNNAKTYRLFTWFLFFLHIVAAGIFVFNSDDSKVSLSIYILLAFYVLLIILYFVFKNRKSAFETLALILALLYANFWFQHVGLVAALIFAAIYVLAGVVQGKKTTIMVQEDGVHLTRVFKTVYFPWEAMDNVILKDSLLTVDFKTNKIIQIEIVEGTKLTDESEFNLFCTEQLKRNALVQQD